MNIYVSNIPYQATDEDLHQAFSSFGEVSSARIIMDRATGRSRGFGFVEMPNEEEAKAALQGVNGLELNGRKLNAREARPRAENGGLRNGGSGNGSPRRREGRSERDGAMRHSF